MMVKYYLAPTVGTGIDADPYRPKVDEYQCNWTAVYENPEQNSSIVAVSAEDEVFAKIAQDAEITYLGDETEVITRLGKQICDDNFQLPKVY